MDYKGNQKLKRAWLLLLIFALCFQQLGARGKRPSKTKNLSGKEMSGFEASSTYLSKDNDNDSKESKTIKAEKSKDSEATSSTPTDEISQDESKSSRGDNKLSRRIHTSHPSESKSDTSSDSNSSNGSNQRPGGKTKDGRQISSGSGRDDNSSHRIHKSHTSESKFEKSSDSNSSNGSNRRPGGKTKNGRPTSYGSGRNDKSEHRIHKSHTSENKSEKSSDSNSSNGSNRRSGGETKDGRPTSYGSGSGNTIRSSKNRHNEMSKEFKGSLDDSNDSENDSGKIVSKKRTNMHSATESSGYSTNTRSKINKDDRWSDSAKKGKSTSSSSVKTRVFSKEPTTVTGNAKEDDNFWDTTPIPELTEIPSGITSDITTSSILSTTAEQPFDTIKTSVVGTSPPMTESSHFSHETTETDADLVFGDDITTSGFRGTNTLEGKGATTKEASFSEPDKDSSHFTTPDIHIADTDNHTGLEYVETTEAVVANILGETNEVEAVASKWLEFDKSLMEKATVIEPYFSARPVCKGKTPPCCLDGNLEVNLGTFYRRKGRILGNLDGALVKLAHEPNKRYTKCSLSAEIKVTFESMGNEGCFGCTRGPYCGRRMLQLDLELSQNKRSHFAFEITDSSKGGGGAIVFARYPNIVIYPRDSLNNGTSMIYIKGAINAYTNKVTVYIGNQFIRVTSDKRLDENFCHDDLFHLNGQFDPQNGGMSSNSLSIGINRAFSNFENNEGFGVCVATLQWACPWPQN